MNRSSPQRLWVTVALCATVHLSYSQNLEFVSIDSGNTVISETVITVPAVCDNEDYKLEWGVRNTGAIDLNVKVFRYELNVLPNTRSYLCWKACYGAIWAGSFPVWPTATVQAYVHTKPVTAGNTVFDGAGSHYLPESVCGTSTFRYVAFDADNPNDSTWIDVTFDTLLGVEDDNTEIEVSVYPNPVNDVLNIVGIDMPKAGSAVITNAMGRIVKEANLARDNVQINVDAMPNGIYFLNVFEGQKILASRKFVINK